MIFEICHIRVCCYHDHVRGFHGALRKHSLLHQKFKFEKYLYMLIEFNTFEKHSADSKLSTNTYLVSVATVFRKLCYFESYVTKLDVTKLQPHYVPTRGCGPLV